MNNDTGGNPGRRRAGFPAALAATAVLVTVTACGGSASSVAFAPGGSGVHKASSTESPQQDAAQLLKLATCMRAHGVPSFPNPTVSGGTVELSGAFDFSSPQFKKAARACKSLTPAGLFPAGS